MKTELKQLADQVAAKLGLAPDLRYESHTHQRVYSHPDMPSAMLNGTEVRQHASAAERNPLLCFDGGINWENHNHTPYYREGERPVTSMRVSAKKSADQITKEVERRIMPSTLRNPLNDGGPERQKPRGKESVHSSSLRR